VYVDAMTIPQPLHTISELARRAEAAGFSGLLFTETGRTAYLNAAAAWELQEATDGKFRLGLGTQVRTHVVRRYGADPREAEGRRLQGYGGTDQRRARLV
jgi:alkanesulfonate monooxygenase SsuD/methylene tetrahydromethanopterin reductase-like flavin-dependent oxidoreductase (luciferase family)